MLCMFCGLQNTIGLSLIVEQILGIHQLSSLFAGDFVVRAICLEDACVVRVLKIGFKYCSYTLSIFRVFDWEDGFDSAIEVARHPVGTTCEDVWLTAIAIFEIKDAAVF